MRLRTYPSLILGLMLAGPAAGQSGLEARVARLERILSTEGPSELLLQVQRLQQEVQALRGLVEAQQHRLDQLQRQQRDQYLDIDARLGQGSDADGAEEPARSGDRDQSAPGPSSTSRDLRASRETSPAEPSTDPRARVVPTLPAPETTSGGERDAYQTAFNQLKERRYDEAVATFSDLLRTYPNGEYTPDALFWLGETHYVTRNYEAAITQYDRLIAAYPESPRLPSAMLKVGYIHDAQGREDAARAVLEEIPRRYPSSTEARLATDRLRRMTGQGR